MNWKERYIHLFQELISGIDNGDFVNVENIPDKYTYAHLCALFYLAEELDDGKVLYEQIYDLAMEHGKMAVQKKIRNGEKIKVAFLAVSASEWPAEDVYRLLEKDERCESYVTVSPQPYDHDRDSMLQLYLQTCRFLKQSGHDVREIYDPETEKCLGWEAVGGMPDIVIHLTPWYRGLLKECWIENFPFRCLNCYIPYGILAVDSVEKEYAKSFIYNREFMNFCFRVYTDSNINLLGYQTHEMLRGKNVLYSGYSKMDFFLKKKRFEEEELRKIWKVPVGVDVHEIKRIIIAPHHSIESSAGLAFATFHKNKYFWIYLAKKYGDRVSFIFKPHPNLRARVVQAQVFESLEAYDAYLKEWEMLPNARVVLEEDYRSIFASSDGMIMDSCSFIAEYMYAGKPLLFLKREGQAYNPLGEKIMQAHYTEWGEDYFNIERFLQQVILDGKDTKKEIREEIFREELDYYTQNKCSASEYIYRDLCGELLDIADITK